MKTNQSFPSPVYTFKNSLFPSFFKESFLFERELLISDLFESLKNCYIHQDYHTFSAHISLYLERILKVYGFSNEEREFLICYLYKIVFNVENIYATEQLVFLSCFAGIEKGRGKLKNIKLDWKGFFNYIERNYFRNEKIGFISSHQSVALYNNLIKTIKRNRKYFGDASIFEVLTFFKETTHPYEKLSGLVYFEMFARFHRSISVEKYEDMLRDFIRIGNTLDPLYLSVFAKILRNCKHINLEPYYEELFSIFINFAESLLPSTNKNSRSSSVFSSMNILANLEVKRPKNIIPDIIVNLLLPRENKNHKKVWEYVERLFSLLDEFIHASNEGRWTSGILEFYSCFTSKYIRRFKEEQIMLKIFQREKQKKDETFDADEIVLEPELGESEEKEKDEGDDGDEDDDDNTSENELEQDESDSEEEKKEKEKQMDISYFLDEECHNRFLGIMKPLVKHLILLRETRQGSIINICLKLCYFRPNEIIPLVLKYIYAAFENSEMAFSTIYKILLIIIKPLLTREVYKQGLYEILNILKKANENILVSNWRQTYLVIKLYHRVFSLIPIFDLEDLKEMHFKNYPNDTELELRSKLNKDEDIDMWSFTEELADIALEYFKRIIGILEYIEKPKNKENKSLRTLFINQHNKFWSFFFQSSPRLFKNYLLIIADTIQDKIQLKAQEYFTYLLNCCSLKDPKETLNIIVPILFSKLLKKTKNNEELIKAYSTKQFYFMIEESPIKEKILEYEKETMNKDSKLWYLNLLEDVLSFGREYIYDHQINIEILLIHYFFDEELVVFSKSLNILQKILLSLTGIYPLELSSFNSKDYQSPDHYSDFYKKIGETSNKNFEVKWHETNENEKKYAIYWVEKTLFRTLKKIDPFFSNGKMADWEDESLIDTINLEIKEPAQSLKQDFLRYLMMIEQILISITMRCPIMTRRVDQIYEKFKENFLFKEFENVSKDALQFAKKVFTFLIGNNLINDVQIMTEYLKIISHLLGEDQYNNKMLSLKRWLRMEIRIYKNPLDFKQTDIRLLKIMSCTVDLYTRIYSYSFTLELSDEYQDLQKIILISCFHPFETISNSNTFETLERLMTVLPDWKANSEKMIIKILDFIGDRIDPLSPKCIYNRTDVSKNSVQAYLSVLIHNFDRVMSLYEIRTKGKYLTKILRILNSYENIESQKLQNKLFEIFIVKFFYFYEMFNIHPSYRKSSCIESNILLTKNEKVEEWEVLRQVQGTKQKEEEIQTNIAHFMEIINIANQKLEQEKNHWKSKIIYGLISVIFAPVVDPSQEELKKNIENMMIMVNSDHQFLRQMARPCLLKLLRLLKKTMIEPKEVIKIDLQSFKTERKTTEEFLRTRFLRKTDIQHHFINDMLLGSFDLYTTVEKRNVWKKIEEMPSFGVGDFLNDSDFCIKFIDFCVLDIGLIQDNSNQNIPRSGVSVLSSRFINEIQTMANSLFNKNRKKTSNLKQYEIPYEFYVRILQKFFQLSGSIFFNNTFQKINELSKSYDTREKQIFVGCWVNSFFKTIHVWLGEGKEKVVSVLEEIVLPCLESCSLENYQNWIFNLYNVCLYRDFREIEEVVKIILDHLWSRGKNNAVKMQRFISLSRLICSNYGFRARDFCFEMLERIIEQNYPSDLKQIAETGQFIIDVAKWAILFPINYNKLKETNMIIDFEENKGRFYFENDEIIYEKSECLERIFKLLHSRIQSEEVEKRKNYLILVASLSSKFMRKKVDKVVFDLIFPFIAFHLEFKDEDITDASLLKSLNDNILTIARAKFSANLLQTLISKAESSLKNENWRVRFRALTFFHHFSFSNFYYFSLDKLLHPLLPILNDDNPIVSSLAMKIVSDLLKLANKEEIEAFIKTSLAYEKSPNISKSLVKILPYSLDERVIGVYSSMCLLLAFPSEVNAWTEEVLLTVLKNKKIAKKSNEKIKEFCSKFWKNRSNWLYMNEIKLSEDIMQRLTEIANPYNYFA